MFLITALTRKKIKYIGAFVQVGAIAGIVFGLLLFVIEGLDWLLLFRCFIGGGLIALAIAVTDQFYLSDKLSNKLFISALLMRSFVFAILVLVSINFASALIENAVSDSSISAIFLLRMKSAFGSFAFIFLCTAIGVTVLMLARLTGFEWLMEYLAGRYHLPTREQRIFMQVNLDPDSVSKLDNLELCALLQDFYYDLSDPITLSNGQIYQCRDSELIITWVLSNGKANYDAIECYFMMLERLENRQSYYKRKFGITPQIKSGIHAGEVVSAWVGDTKKSLIFRGDVPHIASRIQSVCNLHHANLLVSSDYYDSVQLPRDFNVVRLPAVSFRGKSLPMSILKIEML